MNVERQEEAIYYRGTKSLRQRIRDGNENGMFMGVREIGFIRMES